MGRGGWSGAGFAVVGVLLALASTGLRREYVDPLHEDRARRPEDIGAPSAGLDALRILSVEHHLAASDAMWLSIVQEFGKAVEGRAVDDKAIAVWAEAATDLDPLYLTIYHSVAINFTVYSKRVDESDRLLMKGQKNLPQAWQLPFMLGYNAFFLRGDPGRASELWESASRLPRAPRFLLSLAARARFQSGDTQGAEQVLEEMLPHLDGPAREDAVLRLKAFRSEPILVAYDEACARYREAFGRRPEDPKVLLEQRLVSHEPFDLMGNKITLDENCRAHTSYIRVREDEAAERAKTIVGPAPDYLGDSEVGQDED